MAAKMDKGMPWEYWRVQFAERGICRWEEFDEMSTAAVATIIAVWDGLARVQKEELSKRAGLR